MSKAIEPVGDARNDYEIFSRLASRLGATEQFTEGRSEPEWLEWFWERTQRRGEGVGIELPDFEIARKQGMIELPEPTSAHQVFLGDFRSDPVAHPLATPSGRLELFSETLARFDYANCPGHPTWLEPSEWLGRADDDELHLISNQPMTRLHSQHDAGAVSRANKIDGREPLTMHPDDAAARGLVAGCLVRVFNERGAFVAGLVIADSVMAGVAQIATGATYDPYEHPDLGHLCLHGNPNAVTQDIGTSSLAQGPSSSTTLVRVEAITVDLPEVGAFIAPIARAEGPDTE